MKRIDLSPERTRVGNRVTIRRRGKRGIYTAEFWHDAQHRRQSLRTTNKRIANQRAVEIEHRLAQGEYTPRPPAVTIQEAKRRYLGYLETEGRAPKTIVRYRGELAALAQFMERKGVAHLSKITVALFDSFRAERKKDRCTRTVYHEGVVGKQWLMWCESRGLVQASPLSDYRLTKPPKTVKPAPTLRQVNAILAKCSLRLRTMLSILAFTGMRVGELQGLRKEDAELDAGFVRIWRQVHGPTKTASARRIPIHRRIKPLLSPLVTSDKRELLFTALPSAKYPVGGHHINPKRLNEDFKRAAKRAGVHGLTLHQLRHFFNTATINAGVPERVVRLWMGHTDRSMTGLYYDLTDDESRRFMDAVSFEDDVALDEAAHERRKSTGEVA